MENQSLTPREIELHNKLTKVGERILWYFRTRESERTYLSLTHGGGSKSWMWLNLCANNAAKFTISYKEHECTHNREFNIKYNDDVILSGKVFPGEMSLHLYWNNWCKFAIIDLNKNVGDRADHFNDNPKYPDLVTQKDLLEILKIVSQELDIAIVTGVQKKPKEPEELKEIAKEHDKEVLSDFCNTLKEFSEEYADSWLINKFNKLIGVLKNYCFNINQIDKHKERTVRISYDWSYMFNRNLLPLPALTVDRYYYDYNPTSFKISDMRDSNGDLMVKVDHETFEINFYFYHTATEPFLTISAIDYMGHVKHPYCDSHGHMDKFKFKYLTELIEKELKIQIMNPFADPIIIDDTWKDTNLVSEIIEGSSVVNDTWKNPDPINTTNFKGVKKMTFAKLRTIVLSWISQNIMCNNIFSTVTTSHDVPGVAMKITVTEWTDEKDLFINVNSNQTEFIIYEGFFGFPNKVITIRSDEKTNSHDVEFNNHCAFTHFSAQTMLSLYNTICAEMGKESNADSTFTPPSVANIVNRYGNMSISPRYEVTNTFDMADGTKVINGLKLLSMNIMKSRDSDRDFTGAWVRIIPRIKSILFNEKKKVTTIIWNDNTKTMAKCTSDDDYDEELGVAICIAKKYYDNNQSQMRKEINKFKTRQKKHDDIVQKRLDKKKAGETKKVDKKEKTNETTEKSDDDSSDDNHWVAKTLNIKSLNDLTKSHFIGKYIWEDGKDIYYSNGTDQYVLDKATSTWNKKTWNGFENFYGDDVWSDGENIYHSYGSAQYVLDKTTLTWNVKTWIGLTGFGREFIWKDGDNIYYSYGTNHYVLDKDTSSWFPKTWNGLTNFSGCFIWTDGDNIYYSDTSNQYVLDKSTSTWNKKTWIGIVGFNGGDVWSDGNNIYYSYGSDQYVLDKSTSTWNKKTWDLYTPAYGRSIWTDKENTYYSDGPYQYMLSGSK